MRPTDWLCGCMVSKFPKTKIKKFQSEDIAETKEFISYPCCNHLPLLVEFPKQNPSFERRIFIQKKATATIQNGSTGSALRFCNPGSNQRLGNGNLGHFSELANHPATQAEFGRY